MASTEQTMFQRYTHWQQRPLLIFSETYHRQTNERRYTTRYRASQRSFSSSSRLFYSATDIDRKTGDSRMALNRSHDSRSLSTRENQTVLHVPPVTKIRFTSSSRVSTNSADPRNKIEDQT